MPKVKKDKNPGGRPTTFTPELLQEICDKIAISKVSVTILCEENPHWPNQDTFYTWLLKHKEFSENYNRAKRNQIDVLVNEILNIMNDDKQDVIIHGDKVIQNTVKCSRDKLKVDTIKWLAGKLAPKIYGDRIQTDLVINDEEDIKKVRKLVQKCNQSKE